MRTIFTLIVVLASCVPILEGQARRIVIRSGPPPGQKSIWVLQSDNKLVGFDATDFRAMRGFVPPPEARKFPEGIQISSKGMALFAYPPNGISSLRRVWQENVYNEIFGGADEKRPAKDADFKIVSATPDVYFSETGNDLFWFETRIERLTRQGEGDVYRDASFISWTTDAQGEQPTLVHEFPFARCECHGACSDVCPEAKVWAPRAGVSDFFYVTQYTPGQLGAEFLQTDLIRRTNGKWSAQKLAQPVEEILDATEHGETFIAAMRDAGCCAWVNDSDDSTAVYRGGKPTVIYDERTRFHNENYDVSFYTANALFSPDAKRAAYTLESTFRSGEKIRVSSEGHEEDAEELKRVQASIAEMPRVEVITVADPKKAIVSIPHAEFVDWLDDQKLVIIEQGEVFFVDTRTGTRTPTGIKAEKREFVFVR